MENLQNLAEDIIKKALALGVDAADVVIIQSRNITLSIREGKLERLKDANSQRVGLRVFKDKKIMLTSSSDFNPDRLDKWISEAVDWVGIPQPDEFAGLPDKSFYAVQPFPDLKLFDSEIENIDINKLLEMAIRGEAAALNFDPRIVSTENCWIATNVGTYVLADSNGFNGFNRGTSLDFGIGALVNEDGSTDKKFTGKKRTDGLHVSSRFLSKLEDPESIGKEAAERTLLLINPRQVKTIEVPVVWSPDNASSLLRNISWAANGGSIYQKASFLCDKKNTQIASPLLTLVDDPLMESGVASRPFDGEGCQPRKRYILNQGVLEEYLMDCYSMRKLGDGIPGCAGRDTDGGPGPGTSNLYLIAGTSTPEELIASIDNGLYVTGLLGFGFDAQSGSFSQGATGIWIENGKLTYPVSEITLSGDFGTMLMDIDGVGNDLKFRRGANSPTLRMKKIMVVGS